MDLILEILKLIVPTVIAIVSLYYAIKQRSLVRTEISKKRYLESALSSLNESINFLKNIDIPDIHTLWKDSSMYGDWEDACFGTHLMTDDILRANFELKVKKIRMEVSYYIIDRSDKGRRLIRDFDELEPQWLVDFFRSRSNRLFSIECETLMDDYVRDNNGEPDFAGFESAIELLKKAIERLSSYEEVYETVSPNSIEKANQLFEDITEEIFRVICKPKLIDIYLDKFDKANDVTRYIFEEILNYSHIAKKFSKVSKLISELTKARKELFLKIS